MQKTLLWDAFATLDRAELRDMAKFVRSPFFNGKPQLVGLADYLRTCAETNAVPDNDEAFAATYPDLAAKGTDMVRLRLATSDLLALVEHYWVYKEKCTDLDRGKIRLASVYRRRGLQKHFEITLREARQGRTNAPWRHAEHYHDLYMVEWEQFQFAATQKRYDTFNLQAIHDLMDEAYMARKLRLACLSLSHQTVTGQTYQLGLHAAILQQVEALQLAQKPAIGLYYHAYHFLAQGTPDAHAHFFRFKDLLIEAAALFPPEEMRTLYLLGLNYCIKNSNTQTDKAPWYRQTLDIYREALELGILLENGHLSRFAMNNITSIALYLGETDWAAQFIEKHMAQVEKKFRAAARSLNMAKIAFARREFAAALQLLQEADYRDLISGMSARIIQLKVYYEQDNFDVLESHLDSIKTYLHRQRATGYHRDSYLDLVRYTRALMRCNFGNKKEVAQLRQSIAEHPTLMEKEWLLGALGEGQ
jgi:hypothetical protein